MPHRRPPTPLDGTAATPRGNTHTPGRMVDTNSRIAAFLRYAGLHPTDVPGEGRLVTMAEAEAEAARRGIVVELLDPLPTPNPDEARFFVRPMIAAGAHLMRLRAGSKTPVELAWQDVAALTEAEAVDWLARGNNIGINLLRSGTNGWLVLDAENAAATALLKAAGLVPTAVTANAQDPTNTKLGGSHIWLPLPASVDPAALKSTMQIPLPNGGIIDVLVGARYAVAPGTRLDSAPGFRYNVATAGAIRPGSPTVEESLDPTKWILAPDWLLDPAAPAPDVPGLEPLIGVAAQRVRIKRAPSADSDRITQAVDEIPWSDWLRNDPRVQILGVDGACGCDVFHWAGASTQRSGILHDGCQYGFGVHAFSGTLQALLGGIEHASRLHFAAFLRGKGIAETAAAYGISMGAPPQGITAADILAAQNRAAAAAGAAAPELQVLPGGGAQTTALPPGVVPPRIVAMQGDPGPYPVHALPPTVRALCEQMVSTMAVPAALVAPAALAFLSAACGPAITLVRPGWTEPGALWFNVAAHPGARKTPVLKILRAALAMAAELIDAEREPVRREAQIRANGLEKAAAAAEATAEKAVADEVTAPPPPETVGERPAVLPPIGSAGAIARAVELRLQADSAMAAVPNVVRLEFSDATPEAMQDILATQRGRGFLVQPEAGGLLDSVTRTDSKRVDPTKYLSARDEEAMILDRIGRGNVTCERPSMTVLLFEQVKVLRKALTNVRGEGTSITENGFIDRPLHSIVDERIPDTFKLECSIDPGVEEAWSQLIVREFVRTHRLAGERIRFAPTAEGAAVFGEIYDHIEAVVHSDCGVREEMWSKAAGNVVRLARLFAQVEVVELRPLADHPIEGRHFSAAWEIVHWHLQSFGHFTAAPAAITEAELLELAKAAIRKTLAAGPRPWKSTKGRPGLWNLKAHRKSLRRALAELIKEGTVEELDGGDYRLAAEHA